MRLSLLAALLGVALAFPDSQPAGRRGCPYTSSTAQETTRCPYSKPKIRRPRLENWSRRAEGKDGVLFMNRIAPGTSELYVANADGSDEQKLLGNESTFEYHASFSPDGQWIIFTTERNGDGNSVSAHHRLTDTVIDQLRTSTVSDPTAQASNKSLLPPLSKMLPWSHQMARRSPTYRPPITIGLTSGCLTLLQVTLST